VAEALNPPAERRDGVEVELRAGNGPDPQRLPHRVREGAGPQQDRVSDALWEREPHLPSEPEPAFAALQPLGLDQDRGHLLDEEGDPLGPLVHGRRQGRVGRPTQQAPEQPARLGGRERLHDQLAEAAGPAQLGAESPDGVRPGDGVAAVGADQQHRRALGHLGQEAHQVQGGLVAPLQVVDEHP
jgi:hypothetical protein